MQKQPAADQQLAISAVIFICLFDIRQIAREMQSVKTSIKAHASVCACLKLKEFLWWATIFSMRKLVVVKVTRMYLPKLNFHNKPLRTPVLFLIYKK